MKIIPNYSTTNFSSTKLRYTNSENGPAAIYCITCFFRKDTQWDYLVSYLDRKYENENSVDVIDLACSDGSETYSLAMLLDDRLKEKSRKFFPIKGYDLSSDVIDLANKNNIIISPDDYFQITQIYNINFDKYFNPQGICFDSTIRDRIYFIDPSLKEKTSFKCEDAIDVLKDMPDGTKNTVILLKNALPYIKKEKREEIYKLLGQKLGEGSIVIFGDYDQNVYNEIKSALSKEGFNTDHGRLYFEKIAENSNYSDCAKAQALFRLDSQKSQMNKD